MIPSLNIIDNLVVIGKQPGFKILKKKKLLKKTLEILTLFELNINCKKPVSLLTPVENNILQIAKAYSMGAKIIILDDIAQNFEPNDYYKLLNTIRKLKDISFIYLSNRDDPVLAESDRIAVLRRGSLAGFLYKEEYNPEILTQMSTGYHVPKITEENLPEVSVKNAIVMTVNPLQIGNSLFDISLNGGDIMGILVYNEETRKTILKHFTEDPLESLVINGKDAATYSQAIEAGLGLFSDELMKNSSYPVFDRFQNITFQAIKKISRLLVINKRIQNYIYDNCRKVLEEFENEKDPRWTEFIMLAYKWLAVNPKFLLVDNITSGFSPENKVKILKIISLFAQNGVGVLFLSSDIFECYALSNSIFLPVTQSRYTRVYKDQLSLEECLKIPYVI